MNFDWFTLGFCIIIALSMLIGFLKGGLKTVVKLAIVGVAILISVFLADKLSGVFRNGDAGTYFYGLIYQKIESSSPEAANPLPAALVASGAVDETILEAMTNAGIPSSIQSQLMEVIKNTASQPGTLTINIASTISSTATDYICIGLSYIVLFLGSLIVLFLIYLLVSILLKLTGKKPGLISRLLGIIIGFAEGAAICWCVCLFANFALASSNSISDAIRQMIHLDDPSYWSLAKWMISTDFGYSSILNFFLK